VDYLMAALTFQFPGLQLTTDDVLATYAGVRPVIDTGKADPSKEGRDHAVWMEQGLLTVTGGKLTTFRLIALDALQHVEHLLPPGGRQSVLLRVLRPLRGLPLNLRKTLCHPASWPLGSHYCTGFRTQCRTASPSGTEQWAAPTPARPLRRAAAAVVAPPNQVSCKPYRAPRRCGWSCAGRPAPRHVVHLQDLLLRRTRLGLLLRGGGADLLPKIRTICQSRTGLDRCPMASTGSAVSAAVAQPLLPLPGATASLAAIAWRKLPNYWFNHPTDSTSCLNPPYWPSTTARKACAPLLFDLQGNIVAKAQVFLEAYFSTHPGWAEHDPEDYWQAVCTACQRLWTEHPNARANVRGVAITTQRGTMINLDMDGKPLRPAITWLDQRRTDDVPPINLLWKLGLQAGRCVSNTINYFRGEAEANWIKAHQSDIWDRTHKYIMLSGYLNYRLSGLLCGLYWLAGGLPAV
jgi:hypothetical protein